MKMREGPLSGAMPTENAEGNIISPARTATMVSTRDMFTAVLSSFVRRLKYEAYVQRHPMPMLSE